MLVIYYLFNSFPNESCWHCLESSISVQWYLTHHSVIMERSPVKSHQNGKIMSEDNLNFNSSPATRLIKKCQAETATKWLKTQSNCKVLWIFFPLKCIVSWLTSLSPWLMTNLLSIFLIKTVHGWINRGIILKISPSAVESFLVSVFDGFVCFSYFDD